MKSQKSTKLCSVCGVPLYRGKCPNDWRGIKKDKRLDYFMTGLVWLITVYAIYGIVYKSNVAKKQVISTKHKTLEVQKLPIPQLVPTPSPKSLGEQNRSIGNLNSSWVGKVSHYSRLGCLGCSKNLTMANGETLDDNRMTIAFNWLPLNTSVRVTNLDNGKSVIAIVTDTGGFNALNRIADLVPAVANALETKTDVSNVLIEKL